MMVPMAPRHQRSARSRALHARDAGLRRISIVTRVTIAGSVAAAGAFTAVAASAQPGHAKTAPPSGSAGDARALPASGASSGLTQATTPPTSPATVPQTTAPGDVGYAGGDIAPPPTLPDPGYTYSGPAVVSGQS